MPEIQVTFRKTSLLLVPLGSLNNTRIQKCDPKIKYSRTRSARQSAAKGVRLENFFRLPLRLPERSRCLQPFKLVQTVFSLKIVSVHLCNEAQFTLGLRTDCFKFFLNFLIFLKVLQTFFLFHATLPSAP